MTSASRFGTIACLPWIKAGDGTCDGQSNGRGPLCNSHSGESGEIGVPIADQAQALDFYVGQLGFEICRDVSFGNGRWIEVAPPGATTTIALVPIREGVPAGVETGIRLTTADADADHVALQARGVEVDHTVLRMGPGIPPMFYFRDPDGNRLVIVGQG